MAGASGPSETPVVPAVAGLVGAGAVAVGFGAGYGARSWKSSAAYKELIEKFPEAPTLEAEAAARAGAGRALMAGTALAGLMGLGAIAVAKSYGINNIQQFGDEIKRWLPSKDSITETVQPKLEPLQRTITESLPPVRDAVARVYGKSGAQDYVNSKAQPKSSELQPWEKDLLAKLEETPQKKH